MLPLRRGAQSIASLLAITRSFERPSWLCSGMGSEQTLSPVLSFWNPDAVSRVVGADRVSVADRLSADRSISRKAKAGSRVGQRIYNVKSHIEIKGRS